MKGWVIGGLALLVSACTSPKTAATVETEPAPRWVAVLVAGDASLPVFDNATDQIATLLRADATPPVNIHRLSAKPAPGVGLVTKASVLDAVAGLNAAPGQSCLVFITSHGARGAGVYLAPREEFLPPGQLDAALQEGCGNAPTVAIVSACYTGNFAKPPMTRPNRIVLTAARADRPSFGCGAGRYYTFYDECLISSLTALPRNWQDVIQGTGQCVGRLERDGHEEASVPQSFVGSQVTGLAVPGG